ncbi:MAG: class I SAM-dependent methyltransferase, partial [Anaerolineales bacterium]
MKIDIRTEAAKYYDSNPDFLNDTPFYQKLIPSPNSSVLELGCGTGRVTLALVTYCQYIQGIDISPAMISIC